MCWWEIDLFWPLLLLSQMSGVVVVGIMTYWIMEYNDSPFSWGKRDGGTISYHSFMMTLGMVFLFGEAMLLFPVPKRMNLLKSHTIRKLMHGITQSAAVIFSIVGLKAIFLAKKESNHSEFYSVHSWLGMTTAMTFFLQYGVATFIYILPYVRRKVSPRFMIRFTSIHSFFGFVLFALAIASCLTGMERCLQLFDPSYTARSTSTLMGDVYSLLMVVFGTSVAFLTTTVAESRTSKNSGSTDMERGNAVNVENKDDGSYPVLVPDRT